MKYRKSKQRDKIYNLLKNTDSHPSASWIYEKLKKEDRKLSLGTVYRNLKILKEQGLIKKLDIGTGFDRFECKTGKHNHLICEECGSVKDIELNTKDFPYAEIERLTGFSISTHRIEFFGLCDKCKNN
jgi:Fur family transcriptional regulator, peroxide stress response regulator